MSRILGLVSTETAKPGKPSSSAGILVHPRPVRAKRRRDEDRARPVRILRVEIAHLAQDVVDEIVRRMSVGGLLLSRAGACRVMAMRFVPGIRRPHGVTTMAK
ncbi:hypothetical protein MKK88_03010 [Methylobacterium sp. E-005]|uniref:hypothetical protein n=1 Tax=Methylobacterium sp. E-005 TaxID=2836549 RepID=UPI001FB922AC|nr:hypothetical protein [Methylobacterium sp. E-005]MCJ2084965.1 hypothetical protein [Methylobacterium sp. E-005]